MEYSEKHPVIFTSDGDTTSQAIGKHIEEITNIYENLNEVCELKADLTALQELDARKVNTVDLQPAIDKTTNEKVNAAKIEIDGKLATKVNTADLPSAINTPINNAVNAAKAEMDAKLTTKASNDALANGLNGKANIAHAHDYQLKATADNFGAKFVHAPVNNSETGVFLPGGGTWAWVLFVSVTSSHTGPGGGGDDNDPTITYSKSYYFYSGTSIGGQHIYSFNSSSSSVTGFCWRID